MSEPQNQPNHMDPAHALLAQLDAEVTHAEEGLAHMRSAGHDHFHQQVQEALPNMEEKDLDAWTRQQAALVHIQGSG